MPAVRIAVTDEGKEVVLRDDGSWSYRDEDSATPVPADFRKTSWGMARGQVRELETAEIVKENDDGLIYRGQVARHPCLIVYFFAQERLVRAKYNLIAEHASPQDYIADFEQLHATLSKKYGTSIKDHCHWIDDRYRDDHESWGKAVALGHLVLWVSWETDATEISLMLRNQEQRLLLEVEYSSKVLENLENAVEEHLELEDF
jgi:hypothetical protein